MISPKGRIGLGCFVALWALSSCADPDGEEHASLQLPSRPTGMTRLELVSAEGELAFAAPVLVGEEWRNAVVLAPEAQWRAQAQVPAGASLRFGYGRKESGTRLGDGGDLERPTLTLTLSREGESVHEQVLLMPGRRKAGRTWKDVEVPLEPYAGDTLEFTFAFSKAPAVLSCALTSPRLVQPRDDAPTVVLITSDTHRRDHLGLSEGGGSVETPVLDQLARDGVLFEDCFAGTNITLPSHASILTGLSVRDTGLVSNSMGLLPRARALAEAYAEEGWFTMALFSAQHLRHGLSGLGQGFDRMRGPTKESEAPASISIGRFDRWLETEEGIPVFIWLHLFDAHAPYKPPEELERHYYDVALDPCDSEQFSLPAGIEVPWAVRGNKKVLDLNYILGLYKSEVTHLDRQLAALMDHPRVRRSTLAFTSDHGEVLGNHGLYFMHQGIYPDTLAVPLILRWPGSPKGLRVPAAVTHQDLGRTLLDLSGLSASSFPGNSLLQWVEEPQDPTPARYAISSGADTAAIEKEGWLLFLHLRDHDSPSRAQHQVELFDLNADPSCQQDRVEMEFERARSMRADLIAWLDASTGSLTSGRVTSPDVTAELKALGYVENVGADPGDRWYEPDQGSPWCVRFEQ
ncbi:MAG: sulfatase [Planctomycetota bacterium]|jgi:arylsulfatase A-like enzyme|nr:sulfatase [Planctomycetota bacterium]MDP6937447.1 sulfatase [Planctomycetota bacterium]